MSKLTSKLRSNWSEKRTRTFSQVLGGMLLGVMLTTCVTAAHATPPNPDHKVTLCHRTGSATNPYVVITTDIASDGYVKGGHNEHEQVGNGLGGDIIPAYQYVDKEGGVFNYPGKNLDTEIGGATGAEILANGCIIPTDESPSPTPTETVTPTPTETPSESPSETSTPPVVAVTPPPPNTGSVKHDCKETRSCTGPKKTAFTGFDRGDAAAAAAGLGILGATLYGASFLRRRTTDS